MIDEILKHIDLKTLLLSLGVTAVDKGHYFMGPCPSGNHIDKNPSWVLYKDTGHHVCYSCGFSGSLNHLVKSLSGKGIVEFCDLGEVESFIFKNHQIVKPITAKGFPIKKNQMTIEGPIKSVYDSKEVMSYLRKRHITDKFIQDFGIFYMKDGKINKTPIHDRVLIPIVYNNQRVSIEARDYTEKQAKKVIYPKGGTVNTLFNYDNLNKNELLYLCEGIMDTPLLYSITNNVSCTFGVNITNTQKEMLKQFNKICLFLDDDKAGHDLVMRFDEWYENEFYVTWIADRDPGDKLNTINDIKNAMNNKYSATQYLLLKSGLIDINKIEW